MSHITQDEWIDTIRGEYLQSFIKRGGAAVKFVVPMEDIDHRQLLNLLRKTSEEENYLFTSVNAVETKIHRIDKLFHKVADQIKWDELAHEFLKNIFTQNGYTLPLRREDFNIQYIAATKKIERRILRTEVLTWLTKEIFQDYEMSQEFRIAMMRLCLDQLDTAGPSPFLSNAINEWLRGELRLIKTLKEALIFQHIARHNARHMLFSLSHWLRINGKSGLIVVLDITRYIVYVPRRLRNPDDGFFYLTPAVLDAYEVLRQFIDGTDEMEGMLIIVLAPKDFLNDDRRGLSRYDALKLRIWDEVRDKRRQNPLASLVRLANNKTVPAHQVLGEVQR